MRKRAKQRGVPALAGHTNQFVTELPGGKKPISKERGGTRQMRRKALLSENAGSGNETEDAGVEIPEGRRASVKSGKASGSGKPKDAL